MAACKQASEHGREATRLESSREEFGTRLRHSPIARASEQARMDASEQPREHACMQACQDASTHCHEGTRLESSREGFGTRLRPPPIARASEQARKQARTHASKQARANAANQAITQAREQASKVASKQSRKHARREADTQAGNQPSKGATMTMTAEMVVGWGSAALLTAILHDANARCPAFLKRVLFARYPTRE